MRVHDQVEIFNMYKALRLTVFYEEISMINIVDLNSDLPLITSLDPLERALVCKDVSDDAEASEWVQILDMVVIQTQYRNFKPLDRPLELLPIEHIFEP